MKPVIRVKDFIDRERYLLTYGYPFTEAEALIKFAELHVKAALEAYLTFTGISKPRITSTTMVGNTINYKYRHEYGAGEDSSDCVTLEDLLVFVFSLIIK